MPLMETSTEIKFFKCLVYFYVILLSLSGALQIFFGATFAWNHLSYSVVLGNNFWIPSTILLCLGPVTYLLCWLGWNAVSRKKKTFLKIFTALLVILVCIQFILSAWSLALREKLPGAAKHPLDISYEEFTFSQVSDHTHIWHKMQYELKCCGVYEMGDYFRTGNKHIGVPWSCCTVPSEPEHGACKDFYQRGCMHVLSDTIRERLFYVSIVLICAAIIQSSGLFCIIQLTILLHEHEKKENDPTELPSTSRSTRERRERRNKELLPLAQSSKVPDSQKY